MLHREKAHLLLLAVVIGVVACSESPTNDSASRQARPPYFTAAARTGGPLDVPEVRIDLPPAPRSWDTSDVALVAAVIAESGHAVVAFKEPASSRALQSGVLLGTLEVRDRGRRNGQVGVGCASDHAGVSRGLPVRDDSSPTGDYVFRVVPDVIWIDGESARLPELQANFRVQ